MTTPKNDKRDKKLNEIRAKLLIAGIVAHECTDFHLKYGALNFYPTSGKIHRDGDAHGYRAKDVDAFIKACLNEDAGIIGDPFDAS